MAKLKQISTHSKFDPATSASKSIQASSAASERQLNSDNTVVTYASAENFDAVMEELWPMYTPMLKSLASK